MTAALLLCSITSMLGETLPVTLTESDGLLATISTNKSGTEQYEYTSPVYTLDEATNTLYFTFIKGHSTDGSIPLVFPIIALAEFYLYDGEGNILPCNFSTNAQEPSEGPISDICDDDRTTYWHSKWSSNVGDYHRLIVTLPEGSTLSDFQFKYFTRFTRQSVPSCIQVGLTPEVAPYSLTLDVTEASLAPDETLTLSATLLPEDATNPTLTWTSSDEKVATVDEYGVVTAVADGEATITVSTTDDSGLSATCVVTVETKEAPASGAQQLKTGDTFTYTNADGIEKTYIVTGDNLIENPSFDAGTDGWLGGGGGTLANTEVNYEGGVDGGAYIRPTDNVGKGGNGSIGTAWEIEKGKTYVFSYFVRQNSSPDAVTNDSYIVTSETNTPRGDETKTIMYAHEDANCAWTQNLVVTTAEYKYLQFCARWLGGAKCFDSFILAEVMEMSELNKCLTLDVTEAPLAPNETLALTATLLPEDATNPTLTWTSSNEKVATVDEYGVVTAVADGEATITVSTTDGSNLSASCKVTVKSNVLATSLTLNAAEASLAPDETLTLTATLLPEDATNPTLTWTSSNEKVATVDEYGVVTAVADGEATITVNTTDGSDLSATCVVTVETREAEGDVTDYDNMIYFEDATVFVNTTVTLPLQMKNSASITAVQFDVYLPEGVTIEKTSRGKYNVTFNEDRADNTTHTLSSALQDDGAIRVLCYSTESYDFLGGEGAIFYFPLEIPEMEDGDYDVVIRNIVLTDVSGTKYEIPSMTSTMTVLNVAPGDCNADNTIDVADIVVLANHILGTTADGFVEKAADYNADGAVDVADIVNIANYILNGNHAGARALVREVVSTRAAAAGYSLDILPFVLEAEGSKTIALELTDPTESFTAFQCDLYLPEGISIETNNRGKYKFSFNEERTEAAYHTLSGSLQADGAVRMLCYSTDSEVFLGTEGALIYIPLTADASLAEGVYEFSVAGTVLTYQSGVKVTPDTYKGSIVVGDGGEVQEVKLYGRYTSEVLGEYSTVLAANSCITSVDLTEAIYLPEDGLLTTGNPNTIVYLAEGDALSNAYNVVTGDECASLVLTDGYAFAAPVAFSASQASYGRELAEGKYGTIVLPYAPDTDDYVFYALTSAGDDVLIFDEVETPAANTPYLYKLRDGKSATRITGSEVAVSSELTPGGTAVWQMVGSYANRTIAAGEDGDRYYYAYTSSDNKIHRVTNTLTVKPYRAYFTTSSTGGTQLAIRTRGGEETLIDVTEVDGLCPEVYYDLSGRRVDNPAEGVYIVNGKKVVF